MDARAAKIFVVSCVCALAGCGGSSMFEPRYVAVHNALAASGFNQTGPIVQGSLSEGNEARVNVRMQGGACYTVVALGNGGVDDIDVRVLDEAGAEIARDGTQDAQAAAAACPSTTGTYVVAVRMVDGSGSYSVTQYVGGTGGGMVAVAGGGGAGGGGGLGSSAGGRGSCSQPLPLQVGQPVHGNTASGARAMSGSCAAGDAPEVVYQLRVEQRAQVQVRVEAQFDSSLYLLRDCNNPQTEMTCNDDAGDTQHSAIDLTLDPGTYFVVVDGYQSDSGEFDLIASVATAQPVGQVCSQAPVLPIGQPVTGTTQGQTDSFQATCAGGTHSPDRVYALDIPQRSRVRIAQTSVHDGALYLRRGCNDAGTELACNDDFHDRQHSLISTVLDPGRYFVFTDGYAQGQAGDYTIQADIAPDSGGNAQGDSCGNAVPLALSATQRVDTFQARDDTQGSCGGQGAPDVVYRLDVPRRGRLRANVLNPQFSGVMYLQRTCGDTSTEMQCTVPQPSQPGPNGQQGGGGIDATLQPGTYFLVVDGVGANDFGEGQVQVQFEDTQALEQTCRGAPQVTPGRRITGSTAGQPDHFQATCAGNAESGDQVYKLVLTRRQTVRVSLEADYDAALHMRRDCADSGTELACNDDSSDNRHAFIEQTLERGTYFIVVDGFRTGNEGSFTLEVQTAAP